MVTFLAMTFLAIVQLLSELVSSPKRKGQNFGEENGVTGKQRRSVRRKNSPKQLLMQFLPEGSPAEPSNWCPDEGPLTKPVQEQDHQDDLKVLEHQHPCQKEGIFQETEEEVTQEESHHLDLGEIGLVQTELCHEGSTIPGNLHDSEGSNGKDPQIYDKENLKAKRQEQGKVQARELLGWLQEEVVKVIRLWQQWEVNEVVKIMQEQHCFQVEDMQKIMHQQWTDEEDLIQHGSQKELRSLVPPQRRQDHEHSSGNWDQCQKKEGVVSLMPQQDRKLSEVLSIEAQLGREDQKTVQPQSPDKGWPIQAEPSELSQKEGQKDDEPKVLHLEQQKENITSLTGIPQVLQVIKQQYQCQKEAILEVMHQQQTHQEEAIQKAIGQQRQVEVVLEVMRQGWQRHMEAILKTVKVQQQSQEKAILKVFSQLGHQGPCEEENDIKVAEQNQEEERKSKKHKREIPNYFVAIPITIDQVLDKIEDVQEFIYGKEPELLKTLIPVQAMHITIITAHLRTDQDVQKAISALEQSKICVVELLEGKHLTMTFHRIGQFSNQVIYLKMSGEQEQRLLSRIAEAVERSFQEMNIDITGSKDFQPHLTFLKLSKAPALRRKGFRKTYSKLYREYEDCPFGTEVFSQIDLCSMHKKKQESGYYHCECTISVAPRSTNVTLKLPVEIQDLEESHAHFFPDLCPEARTTECCQYISCVAEDDEKPTEYIISTGAGCETADRKTGIFVSDEISPIDGKVLL